MAPIFEKITIIGMGLIGSSIALATRRAELATSICGCDAGPDIEERVTKLSLVDKFEVDPGRAVADADLVIMAVPVGAMADLSAKIVPHMEQGAILSDTGSTKRSVVRGPHRWNLPRGALPSKVEAAEAHVQ